MNTLGRGAQKKGPANFEHIPRPGREAGGGPPLFNFEHGVQNVKKVHIPAAPGKTRIPRHVKKLRPGGSGAAAGPLLNSRCWPGRPRRKKGGPGFRALRDFRGFRAEEARKRKSGGGASGARGAGGRKKRGAARRKKIPPGRRKKMPPRRKNGAGRGRPRQPIGSPPHRLIGRTASGLCPTRTA